MESMATAIVKLPKSDFAHLYFKKKSDVYFWFVSEMIGIKPTSLAIIMQSFVKIY